MLDNFNNIYNKFLFEWSQGNSLSDIISDLKKSVNYSNAIVNQPIESNQIIDQPIDQLTDQNMTEQQNDTTNIKNTFYQIFPSFLLHKCQTKFPLQDDSYIPNDIIDNFWNVYQQLICKRVAEKTVQCLKDILFQILLDIFGPETEYNDSAIFNQSAMKLVKLNII